MLLPQRNLLWAVLLLSCAATLRADVIADAVFSFPAQTEYFEYDNLALLRTLPSYDTLRQNFAGKLLEDAKSVLAQLGVPESQVQEVVVGSSPTAAYGLAAGSFNGELAAKHAKKYAAELLDTQVFCTGRETCVVFLEDSLAAFGPLDSLKNLLLARQGSVARFSANRDALTLLNKTERTAPVRGILSGGQLRSALSNLLPDLGASKTRLTGSVSAIGYSVGFQSSKAHVSATLECGSRTAAALLAQMLNALGTLQSVLGAAANTTGGLPFQNLQVSSSGSQVSLQADSPIAVPTPAR